MRTAVASVGLRDRLRRPPVRWAGQFICRSCRTLCTDALRLACGEGKPLRNSTDGKGTPSRQRPSSIHILDLVSVARRPLSEEVVCNRQLLVYYDALFLVGLVLFNRLPNACRL